MSSENSEDTAKHIALQQGEAAIVFRTDGTTEIVAHHDENDAARAARAIIAALVLTSAPTLTEEQEG